METKLEKLKSLKQYTLSETERNILRAKLSQYIRETPVEESHSLIERGVYHGLRIVLSSFMFLILIGGSVSAVASRSLPGDPLYDFKTEINEEVLLRLAKSPEKRLQLQQERLATRVEEIKLLTQSQTLTKEKQAVAKKALNDQAINLATELSTSSPESALKVTAELEESLKAEKTAIESALLSQPATDATAVLKGVDDAIAKVAEQEEKILQKELDKLEEETEGDVPPDNMSDVLDSKTPTPSPISEEKNPNSQSPVTPAAP